jgi:thiamine pyrophosphokinase
MYYRRMNNPAASFGLSPAGKREACRLRGIAFIGGEGPPPEACRRLAQEADLILAADSGLVAAENAGLRPGWIVGDMDSLDDPARLEKYPPGRVRRFNADKDLTDTELALDCLWEQGCDEVWLSGGGGGRTDHLFAIRALFERDRPPDRWVTGHEDIRCLEAGKVLGLSGLPPGSMVSVFPLSTGPWEAESSGLKWPLTGVAWNRGAFGVSNEATDGAFQLTAIRGRFMVIAPFVP